MHPQSTDWEEDFSHNVNVTTNKNGTRNQYLHARTQTQSIGTEPGMAKGVGDREKGALACDLSEGRVRVISSRFKDVSEVVFPFFFLPPFVSPQIVFLFVLF